MRHAGKINIHAHSNIYFRLPLTTDVLKLDNSEARFIPFPTRSSFFNHSLETYIYIMGFFDALTFRRFLSFTLSDLKTSEFTDLTENSALIQPACNQSVI